MSAFRNFCRLLLIKAVALTAAARAAAPGNDNFADAFELPTDTVVTATNTEATLETGETHPPTVPSGRYFHTVWWKWTAPASGNYNFSSPGGTFTPVLTVWRGDVVTALSPVAQSMAADFSLSRTVQFRATAGTVYLLAVASDVYPGTLSLRVSAAPPPPANDDFANRRPLATGEYWTASTEGSATETGEPLAPSQASLRNSVWFTWTAPSSGWFHFTHDPLENFYYNGKRRMTLWTGDSLDTLRYEHGSSERFKFHAVQGSVYQLRLDGDLFSAHGSINASTPPDLEITGFTLDPSSADLTEEARTITATFTAISSAPLTSGQLVVFPVYSRWVGVRGAPIGRTVGFSAEQRISGDATNGTYVVSIPYPRHMSPSAGWFNVHAVIGDRVVKAGVDQSAPFSGAEIPMLTLVNTGPVDSEKPVLRFVDLSTTKVNLRDIAPRSSMTVRVTAKASDTLSGVAAIEFFLRPESGSENVSCVLDAANRIEGTAADGTYEGVFNIPHELTRGSYRLVARVSDQNGNVTIADSNETYGEPFPGPFLGTVVMGDLLKYSTWMTRLFPPEALADPAISGETADPDQDGKTNLMEYAVDSSPTTPDAVNPLDFAMFQNGLALGFSDMDHLADVEGFLERALSPDGPWSTVSTRTSYISFLENLNVSRGAGFVRVHLLIPRSGAPRQFFRLRVSGPT